MKYFVQYCLDKTNEPDKEGDKFLDSPAFHGVFVLQKYNDQLVLMSEDGITFYQYPDTRFQKVYLALCSKDIEVGDRFNSANGTDFVAAKIESDKIYSIGGLHSDIEKVPHNKSYCYKIIAKISLKAIWAKPGMEFKDNEVKMVWASKVRKTFRNREIVDLIFFEGDKPVEEEVEDVAEDWAEQEQSGHNYGFKCFYNEEPVFLHSVKIKCPCCHDFK